MSNEQKKISRREFMASTSKTAAGIAAATALTSCAAPTARGLVIDGHMHFEAYGTYWEGLIDEIIEHYDYAGVDKGVVFTTWTPSRESNDRTLEGYQKYPDRFIPFGHVRTEDPDWESELKRISELQWKGIKLHQTEISRGPDLKEKTRTVVEKAVEFGIRIVLIHLEDNEIMDELTREITEVTWIIPHMGYDRKRGEMKKYCELARDRKNVYLDTSIGQYYKYGQAIEWAGADKIIFASDGFWGNPFIEKTKIEILQLPTPFRTPRLTDEQLDMILGGNLARILEL